MGILNLVKRSAENVVPDGEYDKVLALAGNPNVGKSTVFNALTGLNQHTGNWPGKTVESAQGICRSKKYSYLLVDTPGTYSLMAQSKDEEVARNFICFGNADVVIVVCDATCLERNLNLALQILEAGKPVVICLNLMDEAGRKHIKIDTGALSSRLKIPVIPTTAKKKKSLVPLMNAVEAMAEKPPEDLYTVTYSDNIESIIQEICDSLPEDLAKKFNKRWLSLKLLENNKSLIEQLKKQLDEEKLHIQFEQAREKTEEIIKNRGIVREAVNDEIVELILSEAEKTANAAVTYEKSKYCEFDRKMDQILCSKKFGYPIMLLLLAGVFYLTISGANYPSSLLSAGLFKIQNLLERFFIYVNAPSWLLGALVHGMYRTLAWVVSVMLPPMAIFFPLFTLLEDAGYLPRIAYNLDNCFKKCSACGKQALTMCMGFGCNAAGIIGCRIIDSPRERLLAILTNSFVPCNGRFPALISIITMFFVGASAGIISVAGSAALLTGLIVLGVAITFLATKILSKTILKGTPSSFTLELPPYRKPQIASVIVRSIFDRTLFVLRRSIAVAAPAGVVLWILANVKLYDITLLKYISDFFDPFASLLGLDGVILVAFILGLPANEIVLPIIVMAYTSGGMLTEASSLTQMHALLTTNGWTVLTALNVMIFSLFHWPCSTTLITIKKETKSLKWTALSAVLPTIFGIIFCIITTLVSKILFPI